MFVVLFGSSYHLHPPSDILARTRASGLNTVQIYVFWNYHEPTRGTYDFITENRNLPLFIQNVAQAGLFMNLRIGPYVCVRSGRM